MAFFRLLVLLFFIPYGEVLGFENEYYGPPPDYDDDDDGPPLDEEYYGPPTDDDDEDDMGQSFGDGKSDKASPSQEREVIVEEEEEVKGSVANRLNSFALKLHRRFSDQAKSNENVALSGLSVFTAFAALSLGANGETKSEMEKSLNLDSDSAFLQTLGKWYADYMQDQKDFVMANKAFIANNFALVSSFGEKAKEIFAMEVDAINTAQPDEARAKMNTWVEENTNGKIKDIFSPGSVTELTRMVLANAIYFKGAWKDSFDKKDTKKLEFTSSDNVKSTVDFMYQEAKFMYGYNNDADFLEISYKGDEMGMLFVLPYDSSATQLERRITAKKLAQMRQELRKQTVEVFIPKFKVEYESNLDSKMMGMPKVFDASQADLSNLTEEQGIYVSKAVHKTVIEIDEEGTEAAGFTGIWATSRSFGTVFRLNKPFLFYIIHKPSEAVIFSGKIMKP